MSLLRNKQRSPESATRCRSIGRQADFVKVADRGRESTLHGQPIPDPCLSLHPSSRPIHSTQYRARHSPLYPHLQVNGLRQTVRRHIRRSVKWSRGAKTGIRWLRLHSHIAIGEEDAGVFDEKAGSEVTFHSKRRSFLGFLYIHSILLFTSSSDPFSAAASFPVSSTILSPVPASGNVNSPTPLPLVGDAPLFLDQFLRPTATQYFLQAHHHHPTEYHQRRTPHRDYPSHRVALSSFIFHLRAMKFLRESSTLVGAGVGAAVERLQLWVSVLVEVDETFLLVQVVFPTRFTMAQHSIVQQVEVEVQEKRSVHGVGPGSLRPKKTLY
ncbi:hypothetical protein CPC08DRAFT_770206 [Agrocybe pediades]|nr:hypothetical protein CPC08DRAFT_770206 [Agrocybe pediades]